MDDLTRHAIDDILRAGREVAEAMPPAQRLRRRALRRRASRWGATFAAVLGLTGVAFAAQNPLEADQSTVTVDQAHQPGPPAQELLTPASSSTTSTVPAAAEPPTTVPSTPTTTMTTARPLNPPVSAAWVALCARLNSPGSPPLLVEPPKLETTLTPGKVVFQRSDDATYWTMNPDGSDRQRLTPPGSSFWEPTDLSPDGKRLLWATQPKFPDNWFTRVIVVTDADGRHPQLLTPCAGYLTDPEWVADGTRIAFWAGLNSPPGETSSNHVAVTMGADGSDPRLVAHEVFTFAAPAHEDFLAVQRRSLQIPPDRRYVVVDTNGAEQSVAEAPGGDLSDVSADGSQLLFYSSGMIHVAQTYGVAHRSLNLGTHGIHGPRWSPDETRILYEVRVDHNQFEIFSVNPDGSDPKNLTDTASLAEILCFVTPLG